MMANINLFIFVGRSLTIADAAQLQDPYFAAALAAANNAAANNAQQSNVNDLANVSAFLVPRDSLFLVLP